MNANELADKLEQGHWEGGTREQVATMLRQQHSELKELKLARLADLDVILKQRAEIELLFKEIPEFEKVFNNEPVAWFEQDENMKSIWYQTDKDAPNAIPLYTHPAKTLTDKEIEQVMSKFYSYNPRLLEFARAILRKAQEK